MTLLHDLSEGVGCPVEFQLPGVQLVIHHFTVIRLLPSTEATAEGAVLYVAPAVEGDLKVLNAIFCAQSNKLNIEQEIS